MTDVNIKRALIAVYDKTGVVDFARALVEEFGIEIISTGGTAGHLTEAGIPVTKVEEVTGFPEMLDGRVKTLHPKIHAAILADRDNAEHMRRLAEQGIDPIDMVVVNLYPFEETIARPDCTFDDAVEMIDVGGPCLLRAATKSHKHVLVLSSPAGYGDVLERLRRSKDQADWEHFHTAQAFKAIWATVAYDSAIAPWLNSQLGADCPTVRVDRLTSLGKLRYGENPHQEAELFGTCTSSSEPGPLWSDTYGAGGRMSFNNLSDANAALELCRELTRATIQKPVCVFVKHTNACGVGVADDPIEAYQRAYLGDPNAAMGGVLAGNFEVTRDFAAAVMETYARWGEDAGASGFFVEVWLAPAFDDGAVEIIRAAKKWGRRVRLVDVGDMATPPDPRETDLKRIAGGVLTQTRDLIGLNEDQWEVVTERQPSEQEMNDLRLAWLVCKHTKSNAVTVCKDGMLIGNGAGQMSRVMSCRIAVWLAEENGRLRSDGATKRRRDEGTETQRDAGAAAASDAFFPFRDGPDLLLDAGVTAIIQPGGSKRDADTIAACNERGAAMIFTHTRHFRH